MKSTINDFDTNRIYSRDQYTLPETYGEDRDQYNGQIEVESNFGNAMASMP